MFNDSLKGLKWNGIKNVFIFQQSKFKKYIIFNLNFFKWC